MVSEDGLRHMLMNVFLPELKKTILFAIGEDVSLGLKPHEPNCQYPWVEPTDCCHQPKIPNVKVDRSCSAVITIDPDGRRNPLGRITFMCRLAVRHDGFHLGRIDEQRLEWYGSKVGTLTMSDRIV